MMPTKFLAPFLLLVASVAFGQDVILSELPGGLKGEIIMLTKKNGTVSIAVKITNVGSRGDARIAVLFHAVGWGEFAYHIHAPPTTQSTGQRRHQTPLPAIRFFSIQPFVKG